MPSRRCGAVRLCDEAAGWSGWGAARYGRLGWIRGDGRGCCCCCCQWVHMYVVSRPSLRAVKIVGPTKRRMAAWASRWWGTPVSPSHPGPQFCALLESQSTYNQVKTPKTLMAWVSTSWSGFTVMVVNWAMRDGSASVAALVCDMSLWCKYSMLTARLSLVSR